jgi:hypothetical protein
MSDSKGYRQSSLQNYDVVRKNPPEWVTNGGIFRFSAIAGYFSQHLGD